MRKDYPSISTDTSESTASQTGLEIADDDLSWWSLFGEAEKETLLVETQIGK